MSNIEQMTIPSKLMLYNRAVKYISPPPLPPLGRLPPLSIAILLYIVFVLFYAG